ncbi:MAG: hypothetical protein ETSY1_20985 [Candidatus Entotheonella factor]|uniref:Cyclic nucleotide-binding domain-containing protein n=1 Tax=Entotheonella factor TaxID=1429438 RepID=W4LJK9_ENTF1|nr:cyclic nucleotide-binding domain-containing protein [Candidatus Entotheonella palauensis]ETW97880.1 MAG: hypothetical protein ETSY1_20985 [Candidatus Entotheonella factor]
MSIRVKIAQHPLEVKKLLSVRHHILVEEDGYLPDCGGYIVDIYDALSTTANFIVQEGTEVIGGIRLTADSEAGMASDTSFDFRPLLPSSASPIACSLLCLRQAYRDNMKLLSGLLMMGVYWSCAQEATHVCAPINPQMQDTFNRIGFMAVSDEFTDPNGLPTVPMILDLAQMSDAFVDFIGNQHTDIWMESYEREFYAPGEVIIEQGTRGTRAYVLIDGMVHVHCDHPNPDYAVSNIIQKGQLFGELALLTDLERSATVSAMSAAEVMVLNRETFQKQLEDSPKTALALLRQLGARFYETIRAMEKTRF